MVSRVVSLVLFISIVACESSQHKGHTHDEALDIVLKSIERHGGRDKWDSLTAVSYNKTTVLFDSSGTVESSTTQHHIYQLKPDLYGQMKWVDHGDSIKLVYRNGEGVKYVNDSLIVNAGDQAVRTMMSSMYVLFMPFKLLDSGTVLFYEGTDTLRNGKRTHVVRAEYSGQGADPWWFYFDVDNYDLVANMVLHKGYFSLIENLEFDLTTGLVLHKSRQSYFVDSLHKIRYLRAQYRYENYEQGNSAFVFDER